MGGEEGPRGGVGGRARDADAVAVWVESPLAGASPPTTVTPESNGPQKYGGTMRRAAIVFVVAVSLLGCAVVQPPGEPVPLLTSDGPFDGAGCYTFQITTKLVPDPAYGTLSAEHGIPVMWRTGYTGRRLDSGEVVVRDGIGHVVATTGNTYTIGGGGFTYHGVSVFWACSYVTPQPT